MPFVNIEGVNTFYHHNSDFLTDRRSIVFVHGAGGNSKLWAYQVADIKGFNRIALDLPGHGRSAGRAFNQIGDYRDFVLKFVQVLGLDQFILVGHSMGGAIALDFALVYPETLTGLIIVSSGARLKVNPSLLESFKKGEHPVETVNYSYSRNVSKVTLDRAKEEMKTVRPSTYLADFMACDAFDVMNRLNGIKCPTLIVCGEDDQMTPVKYTEYLSRAITQAVVTIIKDSGHMVMLEQPKTLNRVMLDFLEAIPRECKIHDEGLD